MRTLATEINKEDGKKLSPFENTRRTNNRKSSKDTKEWAEFPLRAPISALKMGELQRQEAKAEVYLKEQYDREFIAAYAGHI